MKKTEIHKDGVLLVCAMDAHTFFTRLRGLLGRTLAEGEGLLLTPCNQVHTFFMGYPIDVVYLDREGRVLDIDGRVERGRMLKTRRGARRVLELRSGDAEAIGIHTGDHLTIGG